jgi:hypothetical protein
LLFSWKKTDKDRRPDKVTKEGRVYHDAFEFSHRDCGIGLCGLDPIILMRRHSGEGPEHGKGSLKRIHDVALALLDFQPLPLEVLKLGFRSFARPKIGSGVVSAFEHLILFDEENLAPSQKKGAFSPQNDSNLGRVLRCGRGEEPPDLRGMDVFEFLAELALETDFLQGLASHRTTERTPEPSSSSCERQATRKNAP